MPSSPSASRRTVLALGSLAPLALLSGCDDRTPSSGSHAPHPDPDEALLNEVRSSTSGLHTQVTTLLAGAASARTKAALTALSSCLESHLDEFGEQAPGSGAPSPSPSTSPTGSPAAGSPVTPESLLTSLDQHHAALTAACGRAESGNFARLLGCCSAGTSQHRLALETAAKAAAR